MSTRNLPRSFWLFAAAVICLTASPGSAGAPPAAGDWIVTDNTVVENQTITLSGNLVVAAGASLTLQTITLEMDGTYDGEFGIDVAPGGTLKVYDSTIKRTAAGAGYWFSANGSVFEIKRSQMSGCGWGPASETLGESAMVLSGHRGPAIRTDNAIVEECTFSGNHIGIVLAGRRRVSS